MAWGAIAAGAAGLGAGVIGGLSQANAAKKAANMQREGIDAFRSIPLPDMDDQLLQLQNYQYLGGYNPELAQYYQTDPSLLLGYQEDPRAIEAQLSALEQLGGLANQGGMDATSKARSLQALSQADQQAQAQRDAVMLNAQMRGAGGSGVDLMNQLGSNQDASNRYAMAQAQMAADADQRRMQALEQMGQLGGSVRGQSFNQAATTANAQDVINQFNAQNRMNVSDSNAQRQTAANRENYGMRQSVNDQNTTLGNYQQQYNKNLDQQDYENRYKQAQGIAGQAQGASNLAMQQGQNTANLFGGIGQSLIGAGASIYGNSKDDE